MAAILPQPRTLPSREAGPYHAGTMRRHIARYVKETAGGGLLAALLLPMMLLAGCGEEAPKKPVVSANLCVYLPNGMVLGPYDTQKECNTARQNMPGGDCKPCQPPSK